MWHQYNTKMITPKYKQPHPNLWSTDDLTICVSHPPRALHARYIRTIGNRNGACLSGATLGVVYLNIDELSPGGIHVPRHRGPMKSNRHRD